MGVFLRSCRPAVVAVYFAAAACVDAFQFPQRSARCAALRSALSSDREELRKMRVKELQQALQVRKVGWKHFLEKEELVVALSEALIAEASFSASGAMTPGSVAELTAEQFEVELQDDSTPILLDVYATWCGPCQLMAPQLAAAAEQLGASTRVAKIDSDKHDALASQLNVGGLPTVLLFKGGKEVRRVEGALMKDQLVSFATSEGDENSAESAGRPP